MSINYFKISRNLLEESLQKRNIQIVGTHVSLEYLEQVCDYYFQNIAYKDLWEIDIVNKTYKALEMNYITIDSHYTFDNVVLMLFNYIKEQVSDSRTQGKVTYPIDVLIFIILFARLYGYTTPEEIIEYYYSNYLEFYILIPNMPPMENKLSVSTIQRAMQQLDKKYLEDLFNKYFATVKIGLTETITYNDKKYKTDRENTYETYAFDGQEIRASYQKGNSNRRVKGAIGITLYDCSNKVALAVDTALNKNNKTDIFIKLAEKVSLKNQVIMCDVLNSTPAITSFIHDHKGFYLMPMKNNLGNKKLLKEMTHIFKQNEKEILTETYIDKDHSRIDMWQFNILPSSFVHENIDVITKHRNINVIVQYIKTSERVINGKIANKSVEERYYISSLSYDENILKQVKASIMDYWFIETHHNILDTGMLQQDRINACKPNTLANHISFNKIVYNVHSYLRQIFTKESEKRDRLLIK